MFRFWALLSLGLWAAIPIAANADDFRDFRVPTHRVHRWLASGYGSASHRKADYNMYPGLSTSESFQLSASGQTMWLWESDRQRSGLSGGVDGFLNQGSFHREESPSYNNIDLRTESEHQKGLNERGYASAARRCYPGKLPFGFDVSLHAAADFRQDFTRRHQHELDYDLWFENESWNSETWTYRYNLNADAQFGYGKVRNVSGIFSAMIVEDRLRESGALTGELSHATIQKLAELFYRSGDFKMTHMRPDRYFWSEFWTLLKSDPAVKSDAENAYNAYRIAEAPAWNGFYRQAGWFVGPLFRGRHNHDLQHSATTEHHVSGRPDSVETDVTNSSSNTWNQWSDDAMLGGRAEYHLPWKSRWQFDLNSQCLFSLSDSVGGFSFSNQLDGTYIIADRWRADLELHQYRDIHQAHTSQGNLPTVDYWSVGGSSGLSYFLEDRWTISALVNYDQAKQHSNPYGVFERDFFMSIGVGYGPGGIISPRRERY
jgi:hypothetical protein